MWPLASSGTTTRRFSLTNLAVEHVLVRRLADLLPAYSLSAGLGSKLSRWLMPPIRKIQMTFLALGRKWAEPSSGVRRRGLGSPHDAVAGQHWPSANPVKPMPTSARKARRGRR